MISWQAHLQEAQNFMITSFPVARLQHGHRLVTLMHMHSRTICFGGDAVSAKIVDFATKVPSNITGVYYYEARDAVATAITNVIAGSDIDTELQTAEDTVNFNMGQ